MADVEGRPLSSGLQTIGCEGFVTADGGHDDDDIQCDSIKEPKVMDLHVPLITIDEEMGGEDFELLKFLCRDYISVSKLEGASCPLDLFEYMKKAEMICENNIDFLLECLGRMHRFDLVRKLGFDPDAVMSIIPSLDTISKFRILLLDIAEDLDEREFAKMKFYLTGKIKKKRLQDIKSAFQLFVIMEQENLLSHKNNALLLEMVKAINRTDLVSQLTGVHGPDTVPKLGRPRFTPMSGVTSPQAVYNNPQHPLYIGSAMSHDRLQDRSPGIQGEIQLERFQAGGNNVRNEDVGPTNMNSYLPSPTDTNIDQAQGQTQPQGHVRLTQQGQHTGQSQGQPVQMTPPATLQGSGSAGTITVPSEEEYTSFEDSSSAAAIPQPLYIQIANDLQNQSDNLGMEFSFSNDDIIEYNNRYPDPLNRTIKLMDAWKAKQSDKRSVVPGLLYILQKLGCKNSMETLKKWNQDRAQMSIPPEGQRPTPEGQRTDVQGHMPEASRGRRLDQQMTPGPDVNNTVSIGPASPVNFQPSGPPANNYTNYNQAQQYNPNTQQGQRSDINILQKQIGGLQLDTTRPANYTSSSNRFHTAPLTSQVQVNINTQQQFQGQQIPYQGQGHLQNVPQPSVMMDNTPSFQLAEYKMNRNPRGWCCIINNRDFYIQGGGVHDQTPMPSRVGTDKDAESLQYVFEKLGFIVQRRDNLTDTEMVKWMVDMAHNVDHSQFDCFVCCILTHGVLSHLYGSNGRLVSIKDLTATFQTNRCPKLGGKPKLFFLQACQGRDKMSGGEIERDACNMDPRRNNTNNLETDDDQKEHLPNEADFLLGYATVPGYVSFRSRNHGSWYIRKLCELLEKHSAREDLMSILVEVNREVSHANANVDGGFFKQTPAPMVTLRKKLYFR